ncbi:MAG: hypothetical protein JWP35_4404 [Caulobacter sp.]|nr:hypothetical protein [Caulobacter sp.]
MAPLRILFEDTGEIKQVEPTGSERFRNSFRPTFNLPNRYTLLSPDPPHPDYDLRAVVV